MKTLLIVLILILPQAWLYAKPPLFKNICDSEIQKKIINADRVQKSCRKTAEFFEKNRHYEEASWYYLLCGNNDYNIDIIKKNIPKHLKPYIYVNLAHSHILKGDFKEAKELYYTFMFKDSTSNEDVQKDFRLLNKLYPQYHQNIQKGISIWNELYKPLLPINTLYQQYLNAKKERNYVEAIQYLTKLITLLQQLNSESSDITIKQIDLAIIYYYAEYYEQSLTLLHDIEYKYQSFEEIQEKYENLLGWIAKNYEAIDQEENAIKYYQRSLSLREKRLGEKHFDNVAYYNNLGRKYEKIGDYLNAWKFYHKSMLTRDEELGKGHPNADSNHQLKSLYILLQEKGKDQLRLGNLQSSIEHFQKCLEISKIFYGEQSSLLAEDYDNLASVYTKSGNYSKAREYYKKASAIRNGTLAIKDFNNAENSQSALGFQTEVTVDRNANKIGKPYVFLGHSGSVESVVFSPGGGYVLSGSADNTLKLWDASKGIVIRTFTGHTSAVKSIAYNQNGKYALSGSLDKKVKLWDIQTGKDIRTFSGHKSYVVSVAFSRDNRFVLSGSYDNTIKLWDIQTSNDIRTFAGHTSAVKSVAFSPNGKYILSGSIDRTIKLWDIQTGKNIRTFSGHKAEILSVVFSPDGKYILSGSADRTMKLWDIANGEVLNTYRGHKYEVRSVSFSPDGKYILSGGNYGTTKLWRMTNDGAPLQTFWGSWGSNNEILSVTFSPDGRYALSGSADKTIKLWDIKTGKKIRNFSGLTNQISSVAISPNGKYILSGYHEKNLELFDLASGKKIRTFVGHQLKIVSIAFSHDSKYALSASLDKTIKIWDVASGKTIQTLSTNSDKIISIAISPNGKNVLMNSWNGTINVWDMFTGKALGVLPGKTNENLSVALSQDGKHALASGFDEVDIWELTNGKKISTFADHNRTITSVSMSSDGKYALSGSWEGIIKMWDVNSGKTIQTFLGHSDQITSLKFSPDNNYVLSGALDHKIKLWNVKTGKEIHTFSGHTDRIFYVNFCSASRYALSGSWDGTLKLWDIQTGKELLSIVSFRNGEWAAVTPEGYFNASTNGAKYLNILIDPMTVTSTNVYYDHFFRPDLIKLRLQGKEKEYQEAIGSMTLEEVTKNPPPKPAFTAIDHNPVKQEGFQYSAITTKSNTTSIDFNVTQSDNGGVGLIRIYQEGKLIQTIGEGEINRQAANADTKLAQETIDKAQRLAQAEELQKRHAIVRSAQPVERLIEDVAPPKTTNKAGAYKLDLELVSGKNEICIEAFNKTNTVTSFRECVTVNADIPKKEPKLYVITAGANDFLYRGVNNLQYSINDANTTANLLKTTQGKVYSEVHVTRLLGNDLNRENLYHAIANIKKKASLEDTIVFYISSHGDADKNDLYLLTNGKGGDADDISFKKLFHELQSIKSLNQVYIVDTCQSGEAADIVSSVYDSRASVFAKSSGVHMLLATTKGTYAFESQDPKVKHGVFTAQILDALQTKETDGNKDSFISVLELSEQLKKPANNPEYQYPVIQNIGNDVKLEKVD